MISDANMMENVLCVASSPHVQLHLFTVMLRWGMDVWRKRGTGYIDCFVILDCYSSDNLKNCSCVYMHLCQRANIVYADFMDYMVPQTKPMTCPGRNLRSARQRLDILEAVSATSYQTWKYSPFRRASMPLISDISVGKLGIRDQRTPPFETYMTHSWRGFRQKLLSISV